MSKTPPPRPPAPPPPPPPLAFVREGMSRLRIPAIVVLVSVLAQAIVYLVAAAWMVVLLVMLANSGGGSSGNPVPGMIFFGLCAAFNLLSIGVLAPIALGGVRMLRAHGYSWALGGAIVQLAWGIVHGSLQVYTSVGLGCMLAPIEITIAIVAGTVALIVLADRRIHLTFQAVERYPELLQESTADG